MKKTHSLTLLIGLLCPLFCIAKASDHSSLSNKKGNETKLVLVLVIDQFRADYISRFQSRFLPAMHGKTLGGFSYLISRGAYYPAAHYDVLQSMTCPGHAMILTGSYPYLNKITVNEWFDKKTGRLQYCVADADFPLLSESKEAKLGGSPRKLAGTTVGDELKNAGFPSHVITVALKDRAAILMGGQRADLALWLAENGQWTTSTYYAEKLPEWVNELNKKLNSDKGKSFSWAAAEHTTGFSQENSRHFARTVQLGTFESLRSPIGLKMTVDAALAARTEWHLGEGESPDILAVSFSSHDYLGHKEGPNSQEMEELTVSEDREISRFLNALNKTHPGLKNTVIVLTGDHGISPTPEYLKANKIRTGMLEDKVLMNAGESALNKRFGKLSKGSWLLAMQSFHFYIDDSALAEKKISLESAAQELKLALQKIDGVAYAFTEADYLARRLPPGLHERQILKSYVPGRSGDVMIIPEPFFMEQADKVTHMTGYSYDRSVPILLSGPGIKTGVFSQDANVVDIAPTLAFLLGTIPPALSEGRILSEAMIHQGNGQ